MIITRCKRIRTDAFLSKIDARVKVVALFGFVAVVSSLSSKPLLMAASIMITALALISGVTLTCLLRRVALMIPFAGVMLVFLPFVITGEALFSTSIGPFTIAATHEGLEKAAVLSLRVLTAALAVNTLTASVSFQDLMKAFRDLKIPEVFVQVLEFTVRYMDVIYDEVRRMRLARKSRCYESRGTLFNGAVIRTLGQLIGVLFIRSWERGERIYCAMLSRGYSAAADKKASNKKVRFLDLCWGAGVLALAISLRLFESGYNLWQIALFK